MKTIVVPLDGSPLAEGALPYAAALARAAGARLLLARAVLAVPRPGQDPAAARAAAREAAGTALEAAAAGLRAGGLVAEGRVLYGEAASAVLELARAAGADLIVMSTHGRGGAGRWLFGSVADAVLRRATQPVLLVPSGAAGGWAAGRPLRVLVPLDRSAFAEEALGPAAALARVLGGELHLFYVAVPPPTAFAVPPGAYPNDPRMFFAPESELAEAGRYLDDVAAKLGERGMSAARSAAIGDAATTIADTARRLACGMIAMATHGRGGLDRLVLGSVATGVVQHARVPVLLLRPAALARPAAGPAPAATAAAPVGTAVAVPLSPAELAHVRHGLELALHAADLDAETADELRALLARMRRGAGSAQADTALAGQASPAAEARAGSAVGSAESPGRPSC
jgi:nucleotide-binding universal stress UspA family protein